MTVSTISVRVPEELQQDILAFEHDEKLTQTSEAARKLLLLGLENWRQEKALRLLQEGKASFSKAAQIARLDVWQFADLVKERKITWIKNKEYLRKDLS